MIQYLCTRIIAEEGSLSDADAPVAPGRANVAFPRPMEAESTANGLRFHQRTTSAHYEDMLRPVSLDLNV